MDYIHPVIYKTYSEYLKEVEKRKLLIKQFRQPDLILPNSQFLNELFKNGKLHGKTWEECMRGWYNFICPPMPMVFNPKTKKYEYVGINQNYNNRKDIGMGGEQNGSINSVYENSMDLEAILGKDELDSINNKDSKENLYGTYEKLHEKKLALKKKKMEKQKKKAKHKSKKKSKKGDSGENKGKKRKEKGENKSESNLKRRNGMYFNNSGSSGNSFKLKSFGSGDGCNLKRNFGFDSLFDGDLNDDEITDVIFNTFLENKEVNGDEIADQIENLNISEDKKKAILDKFNNKLLKNVLLGEHDNKKGNKLMNGFLDKTHHFFSNGYDPLEDALNRMTVMNGKPVTKELMKKNKSFVDQFLAEGGDINVLRMNENGEIIVTDEQNDGEIFQYELNNIYQEELKKKKDYKEYYAKGRNSINYNTNPNTYDLLKDSAFKCRKKSSDVAWNIIRQWKTDKKIDFKVYNFLYLIYIIYT